MIRKNVAGQHVFFTMIAAATGAVDTGATVTIYIGIDGAAQAAGGGTVTNLGNGQYRYNLSQADTNGNQIGLLFTAASDVAVSMTITTTAADLTDSVRLGLTALPSAPMMMKKNQALTGFTFPMYDSTGAPVPLLTITSQRSINGGAFASTTNSATSVGNGYYTIDFSAADLNGNTILFRFTAAGAQETAVTIVTQP